MVKRPVQNNNFYKKYLRYGAVGIEFSLSVVVGILIGNWADGQLNSAPWLMLLGLLMGLAAGGRSLWRVVRQLQIDSE